MDISSRYSGSSILIIDIDETSGSLVSGNIEEFINALKAHDRKKKDTVVFDLSRKKYLNSSGLGDLIMAKDRLNDNDIELVLMGVAENIYSLLSMVGVADFFKIIKSEDDL